MIKNGLVWLRRDLRLHDHGALQACLNECEKTYLIFVFDEVILEPLRKKSRSDKRVHFIAQALYEITTQLAKNASGIIIRYGNPREIIPSVVNELKIDKLFYNRDYAPYAQLRDTAVQDELAVRGVRVSSFKDHVIFEPEEVLKDDGTPFRVFTPFSRAWLKSLYADINQTAPYHYEIGDLKNDTPDRYSGLLEVLKIADFDHDEPFLRGGSEEGLRQLNQFSHAIADYETRRNYMNDDQGTSKLSVYLRHGCVSVRDLVNHAMGHKSEGGEKWLSELIWREFYQMIAFHFPHVKSAPFNRKFNTFTYPDNELHYQRWKEGMTGFPVIDASMRCLNKTGWMHNRARMIVASFLCKILLVSWQRGERYFAWKLLDYEYASNNGGWQWSSGTGCDAAPYFRIFNPYLQSKKFDPQGDFIKKWCPELKNLTSKEIHQPPVMNHYPAPIVDYAKQRGEALRLYKDL